VEVDNIDAVPFRFALAWPALRSIQVKSSSPVWNRYLRCEQRAFSESDLQTGKTARTTTN